MDLADLEGEAEWIYRRGGFEPDEPARAIELATAVLGPGSVVSVHARSLPGDACLATVYGQRRIYLRRGLSPKRARWAIAHELGHHILGLDSSSRENEDACDALAACLLAPRRAFQSALRETTLFAELAEWFLVSESCAALRLGEVTGVPLALLTPKRVRVRGAEFAWPVEPELRGLVRKSRTPEVRVMRLGDAVGRVAVRGSSH